MPIRAPLLLSHAFTLLAASSALAAGTWTAVAPAPTTSAGLMVLLSDGTVLCKTEAGPTYGNVWNRLTPDSTGKYATGTWSTIAPMAYTRWYFSSQVLRDGRLYVAGGEYGTGKATAEIYNPLTNAWTTLPSPGANVSDANSELLPDGRVLQALVTGNLRVIKIYDPVANTYTGGPSTVGIHNESAWVKLKGDSILMVARNSNASERYHPWNNAWYSDATVPVSLYDPYGLETGGAVLLPDGRAWFVGSLGPTAFYTAPASGTIGAWAAGPALPNGLGAPDAPLSMMPNGKVLCAVSPAPTSGNVFPHPTSFLEFDPATNGYTQVVGPTGAMTVDQPSYVWCFLNLPDGTVMCSLQGSSTYWIYRPDGAPLAAGKPTVSAIARNADGTYALTGTRFNGISQGSSYGDDWQMNTNYPIVRLTATTNGAVRYARTFNWSSTGVETGSAPVTTQMSVPASVPYGTYGLQVSANGISSETSGFWHPRPSCPADLDFDGSVSGNDLSLVLSSWGTLGGVGGLGDLDGSGVIDGGDITMILNSWGTCP